MGPEVPSRARRALPALRRSENEDGRRPSECSRTIQNVSHDCSKTKLDRIMWYTIFWCPMSVNSKLVNNISVALLVFKWAAKIFIVHLSQIYSDQWANSCYTDILFKGLGVYHLMWYFYIINRLQWNNLKGNKN